MELNPKLKFRSPMETPFSMPKSITVFISMDLDSNKLKRCAAWSVQNVTIKCQLVRVVAEKENLKLLLYELKMNKFSLYDANWYLPNGNPRWLIKALLHMTMETDDATERNRAPITPSWKLDISPIFSYYCTCKDTSEENVQRDAMFLYAYIR